MGAVQREIILTARCVANWSEVAFNGPRVSLGGDPNYHFLIFFIVFNLISAFSSNSEGAVRLGMTFYVE